MNVYTEAYVMGFGERFAMRGRGIQKSLDVKDTCPSSCPSFPNSRLSMSWQGLWNQGVVRSV